MVKLSALVCARDEEARLSQCLRRLWFCDQVVVVADRCADATAEIARRHGAVVVEGRFPLEIQRRSAGLAACRGDWILEVEPDERVDSALAWEIRATLKMGVAGDHLAVPLRNYVGDRLVTGGWTEPLGTTNAVRLYRPGSKQWRARRHDAGRGLGRCGGALRGALRREVGPDLGALIAAFDRATALAAEDMAEARPRRTFAGSLARGVGGFVNSYMGSGGWREGGLGLALAALSGLHPLFARLRADEVRGARPAADVAGAADARVQRAAARLGAG